MIDLCCDNEENLKKIISSSYLNTIQASLFQLCLYSMDLYNMKCTTLSYEIQKILHSYPPHPISSVNIAEPHNLGLECYKSYSKSIWY